MSPPTTAPPTWPNNAPLAISLTIDNMGEAADLDRNLWKPTPSAPTIGEHFSVKKVLPQFLRILRKYGVQVTYFIEAWNLGVYGEVVWGDVLGEKGGEEGKEKEGGGNGGHEVAWHAWRHEAWVKYREDEEGERGNVERSFEGLERWIGENGGGDGMGGGEERKKRIYKGFRPPGGIIHGERTMELVREFGVEYISPAGRDAAVVEFGGGKKQEQKQEKEEGEEGGEEEKEEEKEDSIVILPFRWSTVDAYYYMETFSKLRTIKGELPEAVQTEETLKKFYIAQIDSAIAEGQAQQQGKEKGGGGGAKYLSFLFHPFLNNSPERLQVFEDVVKYLAEKRDQGQVWLARCCDVTEWIRQHPGMVGADPGWDETVWR